MSRFVIIIIMLFFLWSCSGHKLPDEFQQRDFNGTTFVLKLGDKNNFKLEKKPVLLDFDFLAEYYGTYQRADDIIFMKYDSTVFTDKDGNTKSLQADPDITDTLQVVDHDCYTYLIRKEKSKIFEDWASKQKKGIPIDMFFHAYACN